MGGTAIDLLVAGEASPEEIDDAVAAWHEGGSGLELHEFLGMTWEEYALWVETPAALDSIVTARRRVATPGDRPRLVTRLPTHERQVSFDAAGRTVEQQVRLSPGGVPARWVIPGVEGTFRSIKDAEAAKRRASV